MSRKHWLYLKYVLRHKWYVYKAGRALGVGRWQLLVHDLSKFRRDEWVPYAEWFYGYKGGSWHKVPDGAPTLIAPKAARKLDFERAFLLHLHRNPHHHQYWVLPSHGDKRPQVFIMPLRYKDEMVADWMGAGMAINGRNELGEWYDKNKSNMTLHPITREQVEALVERFR